jgi:hypothetical protein
MDDITQALRRHNEQQNQLAQRAIVAANIADDLEKSLAPDGTYNIPMLLEKRRREYGIPNGAFESFPAYDKVYIWQINLTERKTYAEHGVIVKPEARIAYDRNTAPRGIIVSAGLAALDSLRSTGIDVGHIVRFKKYAPFMQPVAEINGVEVTVMVIRDGDIVSSEDLATAYHRRLISITNASETAGGFDHRFARDLEDGTIVQTGKKVAAYYDPSV